MARDYYDVLGIQRGASDREIKRAYRKLVKKLHPDRNGDDPECLARFKEVSEAYEVLGDPERRPLYDQFGSTDVGAQSFSFDFDGAVGGVNAGFQMNFEEIFGGRRKRARRKKRDTTLSVQVGMIDALKGCEQKVCYQSESGRTGTVRVTIPPGSKSGDNIRVRNGGAPGQRGDGDLRVTVEVVPHPNLRWEGEAVVMDLPLTCLEAYRGARVSVDAPGGTIRVKIPPGSRTGQKLRLREKGPMRRGKRVDLMLRLCVELPTGSDEAVAKALEAVEAAYCECPRKKLPNLGD